MALRITVIGQDKELEALVRACGASPTSAGHGELVKLAQPAALQPDVVVVDLRAGDSVPPGLAALRRQHAATGIVIVARSLEPAFMLAAMRAGANECVAEPITQSELEAAIARVVTHQSTPAASQAFAVIGVKGGVGATSLAVNIATVLAKVATAKALLLDLHVSGGDAALYLGVDPRFSIADALENVQKLDSPYFGSLVNKGPSGLTLLAAPPSPVAMRLEAARVRTLLDFATKHYEYTVVDVPRTEPGALDALESTKSIVLVTTQELPSVRSAAQMLNRLRARYGHDRVQVVMSRLDREADISSDDVEKVLGGPVSFAFPSDYRRTLAALNKGRPMVLDEHSGLASSWEKFAFALAGVKVRKQAPQPSPGWFTRFAVRRN